MRENICRHRRASHRLALGIKTVQNQRTFEYGQMNRISSRLFSTANMAAVQSLPFTQAVVEAMRKLYPESLADRSFDNTGLLLEAPAREDRPRLKNSVLLTIDLTKAVADEAIRRGDSIIIAYHPIIFRGLNALTLGNSQQNSLLRLAQEGISVYSPHTAVDAAKKGLGDWLEDVITGANTKREARNTGYESSVINPAKNVPGHEGAGSGRIVRFSKPQKLGTLLRRIKKGLGSINGLCVATPQSLPHGERFDIEISSVAMCAGSGGSMLTGLDVDMLFTGELSHHEALAEIERGKVVVTAFHSNTERAFLRERLQLQLSDELSTTASAHSFAVSVSAVDKDPFEIFTMDQLGDDYT